MAEIGPASVSRVVIVTVSSVSYHLCEETLMNKKNNKKNKNKNKTKKRFSVEKNVYQETK